MSVLRFALPAIVRRPFGLLAAALLLLGAGAFAPPAEAAGAGTPEKPWRISLIVYRGCEEACQGFQDFLKSRNVNATVKIYDAKTDPASIPGFVKEIKSERPDLVVTWGSTTAVSVFGKYNAVDPEKNITDIPGVFMIVSTPIDSGLIPNTESSGRNITGTLYLVPESVQLEAASTYMSFKKVGVVYSPNEQNSVINVQRLEEESAKRGVTVIKAPLPLGADGAPDAAAIPALVKQVAGEGVDMLYQGADTFLNLHRKELTAAAVENHLPVFAAGEAPVRTGQALMGVVNQYYVVGQLTALKAEQVLEGASPASIPIEAPKHFSFLINLATAKELGDYPPMKLIRFAEFIR
ncbi:ABC transporter substrate-binding protein [Radicibacter daui]|uniref:ABC transporter substrate-binding protein n=1 Tax=Radicibacter daui TaxID=3064829 RepID=UPI004046ACA0